MTSKFMTAADAVALIRDGDTVGLMGGGGGLMEATHLFEAVQARFLATQQPRRLTVVHALGIGDKKSKGMNCFAHEGLVKRVIGGHWVWSPAMQQLVPSAKRSRPTSCPAACRPSCCARSAARGRACSPTWAWARCATRGWAAAR
jgi:acyl CoA:acetate/3-ketoacid CoA transferase